MDSVSMETNLYMFAVDNVDRHMAPFAELSKNIFAFAPPIIFSPHFV